MQYLALVVAMCMTGCAAVVSEAPPLEQYTPAFLNAAADEIFPKCDNRPCFKPACPVNDAHEGCSAMRTLIIDYVQLRDKIKASE